MTTTTSQNPVQQLIEHIDDWKTSDLLVDTDSRIVRHVALTGIQSRNGYRYSEEALQRAIPLYENKPVFLDHAVNISRPYDRSTRDLVGSIVNPRFHEGRIRGDIQLLDTDAGRTFLALAKANRPAVGMSHVILARRNSDKTVVEEIHDVVSVDAVVFPAATSTFREQTDRQPAATLPGSVETLLCEIDATLPAHIRQLADVPSANVWRVGLFADKLLVEVCTHDAVEAEQYAVDWTVEEGQLRLGESLTTVSQKQLEDGSWLIDRPSFSTTRGKEPTGSDSGPSEQLQERLEQVVAERDRLANQLEGFERRQQTAAANRKLERLISESNLPNYAVTELLRRQLLEAPNPAARLALIRERQTILEKCGQQPPSSRERIGIKQSGLDDSAIVSSIKQHR